MGEPIPEQHKDDTPAAEAGGLPWARPRRKPRPGCGTVYVIPGADRPRWPGEDRWTARWIDEDPDTDVPADRFAVETFEGCRADVLQWARSRRASARLMPVDCRPTWVPLPDDDRDVIGPL